MCDEFDYGLDEIDPLIDEDYWLDEPIEEWADEYYGDEDNYL